MNATVAMISLGCAKNLVDSEVMLGVLEQAGFEIVEDVEEADAVIVNTCGFIKPAAEEVRFSRSPPTRFRTGTRLRHLRQSH